MGSVYKGVRHQSYRIPGPLSTTPTLTLMGYDCSGICGVSQIRGQTALDAEDYRLSLVNVCQKVPETSRKGAHGDCSEKFEVHSCLDLYHLNPA
jgi:hypothetical protein